MKTVKVVTEKWKVLDEFNFLFNEGKFREFNSKDQALAYLESQGGEKSYLGPAPRFISKERKLWSGVRITKVYSEEELKLAAQAEKVASLVWGERADTDCPVTPLEIIEEVLL